MSFLQWEKVTIMSEVWFANIEGGQLENGEPKHNRKKEFSISNVFSNANAEYHGVVVDRILFFEILEPPWKTIGKMELSLPFSSQSSVQKSCTSTSKCVTQPFACGGQLTSLQRSNTESCTRRLKCLQFTRCSCIKVRDPRLLSKFNPVKLECHQTVQRRIVRLVGWLWCPPPPFSAQARLLCFS